MKPIKICPICGSRNVRRSRQTVEFQVDGRTLKIKDIEVDQCPRCGERFYDHEASQKIDTAIAEFKRLPRRKSA